MNNIFKVGAIVLGDSHLEVAQAVNNLYPTVQHVIHIDGHADLGISSRSLHDGNFLTYFLLRNRVKEITWVVPPKSYKLLQEHGFDQLYTWIPTANIGSINISSFTNNLVNLTVCNQFPVSICSSDYLFQIDTGEDTWLDIDLDFFSSEESTKEWLSDYGTSLQHLFKSAEVISIALSYDFGTTSTSGIKSVNLLLDFLFQTSNNNIDESVKARLKDGVDVLKRKANQNPSRFLKEIFYNSSLEEFIQNYLEFVKDGKHIDPDLRRKAGFAAFQKGQFKDSINIFLDEFLETGDVNSLFAAAIASVSDDDGFRQL